MGIFVLTIIILKDNLIEILLYKSFTFYFF